MEDKMGDFHYFKDKKEISQYLNIPIPKVSAIITYSRRNKTYSPSHRVYIQRLFYNRVLRGYNGEIKSGWYYRNTTD